MKATLRAGNTSTASRHSPSRCTDSLALSFLFLSLSLSRSGSIQLHQNPNPSFFPSSSLSILPCAFPSLLWPSLQLPSPFRFVSPSLQRSLSRFLSALRQSTPCNVTSPSNGFGSAAGDPDNTTHLCCYGSLYFVEGVCWIAVASSRMFSRLTPRACRVVDPYPLAPTGPPYLTRVRPFYGSSPDNIRTSPVTRLPTESPRDSLQR